ncbi:glycosyltransferase [Desulfovibrio ferrophilus]|uniref:Glycosyl transferase family 2 n=1 Tax=Desulfovibrio ferrophilus TaxID=241368 RepID=A0A2Z6B1F4_9BACT|nr:glycosyltransferase [Desulfovibrio ferrophilus]BBD09295.1 glycosyl transferase family 2 [Desulfovibrio ferrophilus]
MAESRAQSFANLAHHYRAKGEIEKAEKYEAKCRDLQGDPAVPVGQARTEDSPSEAELMEVVTMVSMGVHDALIKRFGNDIRQGIASAVSTALIRSGENERALEYLSKLPETQEVKLKHKALELLEEMRNVDLSPEPRVHLLLLSYNRADCLENALRQLAATDYSNYAVYIADNNSQDGSWDILQKARDIFPEGVEVSIERFPTNIGRPAGHNWLLEKHDHSAAEFIAIGDDDLLEIPPSWLKDMIKTSRVFPKAAAIGGKALNPGVPKVIHGGVRRFTSFGPTEIELTNNDEVVDYGQFDFVDRVDHVIGCLHIYRRDALLEDIGLFDIRFSPCQYVDIEHHLRLRMKGYEVIYNGFIEFRHLRGMGKQAAADRALGGNSHGNRIKILYKYDQQEVIAMLREEARRYDAWLDSPSLV